MKCCCAVALLVLYKAMTLRVLFALMSCCVRYMHFGMSWRAFLAMEEGRTRREHCATRLKPKVSDQRVTVPSERAIGFSAHALQAQQVCSAGTTQPFGPIRPVSGVTCSDDSARRKSEGNEFP